MPIEPPKRRWFQFRLRTLLIAILVLSMLLSWIAARMERASRQREVVGMIEQFGGYVLYDWQESTPAVYGQAEPERPYAKWLRDLLGDTFFDEVVVVSFDNYPSASFMPTTRQVDLDDDDLKKVARLKHLQRIGLQGANVTDAGLEHLHGLAYLAHLDLHDTKVTPEGVKKLQDALPNCQIEH